MQCNSLFYIHQYYHLYSKANSTCVYEREFTKNELWPKCNLHGTILMHFSTFSTFLNSFTCIKYYCIYTVKQIPLHTVYIEVNLLRINCSRNAICMAQFSILQRCITILVHLAPVKLDCGCLVNQTQVFTMLKFHAPHILYTCVSFYHKHKEKKDRHSLMKSGIAKSVNLLKMQQFSFLSNPEILSN